MKITNICDNEHLSDCGLPDKIISIDGKNTIDTKTDLKDMQSFNSYLVNSSDPSKPDYEMLNTKAAAFETVNGENILVYYNPNCESNLRETFGHYSQSKMCANFIYDLNGKKGPNTVGKDIGFISAIYSIDPVVVAPVPYPVTADIYNKVLYKDASAKCKEIDENAKIPNIYEITSIFYNQKLVSHPRLLYWSSDSFSSTRVWVHSSTGVNYTENMASSNYYLRCVKR